MGTASSSATTASSIKLDAPIGDNLEENPSVSTDLKPFACVIRGCTSQFGADGEAVPHRLSCGDVVCAGCWSAAKAVVNCALCGRKGVTLEFVDEALAIVGQTVFLGHSASAWPRFCVDCKRMDDDEIPATHLCDCGDNKPLCHLHVLVHSGKGHAPAPLDPLASAMGDGFCLEHEKKPTDLFCVTDRERICSSCVPAHAGHTITTADGASAALEPELNSALLSIRNHCANLVDYIAIVQAEQEDLQKSAAASETSINAAFDALQTAIDANRAQGIRVLRETCARREKALKEQATLLEQCLSQAKDGVTLGEQALERRNPGLTALTLKSVHVLSRIAAREFAGPCASSVLPLDETTAALVQVLPRCSQLREVRRFVSPVFLTALY